MANSSHDVQELVSWTIRIEKGEAAGIDEFYDAFPKRCRAFLLAARLAILGAFLTRNGWLFRRVYSDLDRFPSAWPSSEGKQATEIFLSWVSQLCFIPDGYPDWMTHFDWSDVPLEWRYQVGFIAVGMMLIKCQFEAAHATANTLWLFSRQDCQSGVIDMWMALASAIACRELGRRAEMILWFRRAAQRVSNKGFILPFLSYSMSAGSPMSMMLETIAPALVPRIRARADNYYQSAIRARNFLTGSHMATDLTQREFYIASCLKRRLPYSEIAARVGVSVGRVRNLISDVYATLGIHSRDDLTDLVW